jgi:hypothetical protein
MSCGTFSLGARAEPMMFRVAPYSLFHALRHSDTDGCSDCTVSVITRSRFLNDLEE